MMLQVYHSNLMYSKNIITSYCPETAAHVAFKLLEMLTTKKDMERVKSAMGY